MQSHFGGPISRVARPDVSRYQVPGASKHLRLQIEAKLPSSLLASVRECRVHSLGSKQGSGFVNCHVSMEHRMAIPHELRVSKAGEKTP